MAIYLCDNKIIFDFLWEWKVMQSLGRLVAKLTLIKTFVVKVIKTRFLEGSTFSHVPSSSSVLYLRNRNYWGRRRKDNTTPVTIISKISSIITFAPNGDELFPDASLKVTAVGALSALRAKGDMLVTPETVIEFGSLEQSIESRVSGLPQKPLPS